MSLKEILDRFDEKAREKLRNLQELGLKKIEEDREQKIMKLKDIAESFKQDILMIREKAIDRFQQAERQKELESISKDFQDQISSNAEDLIRDF